MGGCKVRRGDTVYEMTVRPKNGAGEADAISPMPMVPTDALGIPVPEPKAGVFAVVREFQEALGLCDRLAQLIDRIAQSPAGEVYRQDLIRTNNNGNVGFACPAVRAARNKLVAAEPHCVHCPNCHALAPGRGRLDCKKCGGRGWVTRPAFDSCRACDQQDILRLGQKTAPTAG